MFLDARPLVLSMTFFDDGNALQTSPARMSITIDTSDFGYEPFDNPCYTGRFSVTRSGRLNLAQITLKVPVSINCLNYDDSCTSGQDNTRDACVLE
ncbi:hypothetical protein QTP88_006186 [Uroleucon formosanum]